MVQSSVDEDRFAIIPAAALQSDPRVTKEKKKKKKKKKKKRKKSVRKIQLKKESDEGNSRKIWRN